MRFGDFDDLNLEYVIERPDTPRPWTNYLGCTKYGAIITNHAGGYSFYKTAKDGRFIRFRPNAIPLDQPGRYFYLRDNQTKDYWSASWQPVGKDLSQFKSICRHGTAYTVIESEYNNIQTVSTYFVPLDKNYECWILKLKNRSEQPRNLSIFTYVEFANQWNTDQDLINLQYSQYIINSRFIDNFLDIRIHDKLDYNPDNLLASGSWHSFMTLVGEKIAGYDTDREETIGVYNSYHNPRVVIDGRCKNSTSHGDNACGTLQVNFTLRSGEEKEIMVILGVGKAEIEGKNAVKEIPDVKTAYQELTKLKKHWHDRLGNFIVKSDNQKFNSTINVWGAYNCLITYAWSRAASFVYQGERNGLGFRDTVQDFLGVICNIPGEVQEKIELMLTGQFSTGGALPVVKPFEHHPGTIAEPDKYRSDDCEWFFNSIPEYVKETGNLDFYHKVLPYADKGEATVLQHLRRALEFNLERTGKNDIPCGLLADWNDCIVLGYNGETFFVAMQLIYGLKEYIDICTRLNKPEEVKWAQTQLNRMENNILKAGWNGKWFNTSIRDNGEIIGHPDDKEGRIFLYTQCWAVISGIADESTGKAVMDHIYENLYTEYGLLLCYPPFHTKDSSVVRAMVFNDGQKENAGIFTHPQGWAVIAECLLGRGDRAYQYFINFMPANMNDQAEIRQIEPYVYCQSTHGKDSRRFGASRIPWLSGTASWAYFSATHYILGIRPEYEGLTIDPCIPRNWPGFVVKRNFRGKSFQIKVDNPNHVEKGVKLIRINGERINGFTIPLGKMKEKNNVDVVMG